MLTCSISSFILLILYGVLTYRIWDWSNDIFQLTRTQVIDIDKKPLGMDEKKTASLDAPDLRIEHIRPSLLANLLNFGNVIVYIGPTKFNIEGVFNPDQVHQEVAARREALLYQKNQERETQEDKRMLNWWMAFMDQTQPKPENDQGSSQVKAS